MTDRMSLLAIGGVAAAAFLTWTTPTLAQEARPSAELAGHALHQVAMTTSDLARATVFYRDVLDLPFQFEANGMAFFDVAGVRLMLAVDPSRTEAPPTSIVYFDAPDFADTHRRLVATGVALEGPVETVQRTAAGELRIQQFRSRRKHAGHHGDRPFGVISDAARGGPPNYHRYSRWTGLERLIV